MTETHDPTDHGDFAVTLERLEARTRTFADTVDRAAELDASLAQAVPTCPGWRIGDLVDHLAGIHRWAAAALHSQHAPPEVPRPDGERPADWYRTSAAALVAELRAAGPGASAWTLWGDRVAAFWARRQLHETVVHTFDLLEALGDAGAWHLPEDLALDGIREILYGFYPRQVRLGRSAGLPGVVRFEVTDDAGGPATVLDSPPAHPGDSDADAPLESVRGSAVEIYLGLWNRRPIPGISEDLAQAIRAARLVP